MLTIRGAQMQALQEAFWTNQIMDHVRVQFPAHCAKLGRSGLNALVTRAMKKAREYGFRELADIQQYADLVVVLGEAFESTSEFAWTREILQDNDPAAAKFRATWLYDSVRDHLMKKEKHVQRN